MKRSFVLVGLVFSLAVLPACNQTTVTFHSGTFVGIRADVDADSAEVVLTRGAAMAFDCTELTELWNGPCRDFTLDVENEDVAELVPSLRLDAVGTATDVADDDDQRLSATVDPTSGVLLARATGETTATISSQTSNAVFTVVVIDPVAE